MYPFNPGPDTFDYLLTYGTAGVLLLGLALALYRWSTRIPFLDALLLCGLAAALNLTIRRYWQLELRFHSEWILCVWPLALIISPVLDGKHRPKASEENPKAGKVQFRRTVASVVMLLLFVFYTVATTPLHGPGHGEFSRRSECKNNMKQLGLALHNYHDAYAHFPPRVSSDAQQSWRVSLLPYLDQAPLASIYDSSQPWNSTVNQPVTKKRLPQYMCPSVPKELQVAEYPLSAYTIPYGPKTIWHDSNAPSLTEITDGTSHTFAVVEACGLRIPWGSPLDANLAEVPVGVNLPGSAPGRSEGGLSAYHAYSAHVLFADGSVRIIKEEIDPTVLQAYLTATGGEDVEGF